mgnify:CR=1 FL=1
MDPRVQKRGELERLRAHRDNKIRAIAQEEEFDYEGRDDRSKELLLLGVPVGRNDDDRLNEGFDRLSSRILKENATYLQRMRRARHAS